MTITNPGSEDPAIRAVADRMLTALGKAPVQTVVNTLFPEVLANLTESPEELSSRYCTMYPRIRSEDGANSRGTYFGRLVHYPTRDKPVNQFTRLIDQLRRDEKHKQARPAAIYEMTTSIAAATPDHDHQMEACQDAAGADRDDAVGDFQVFAPTPDTIPMGFPCLSHLSWQRHQGYLHLLARYRHQYLIERGYGNYLSTRPVAEVRRRRGRSARGRVVRRYGTGHARDHAYSAPHPPRPA